MTQVDRLRRRLLGSSWFRMGFGTYIVGVESWSGVSSEFVSKNEVDYDSIDGCMIECKGNISSKNLTSLERYICAVFRFVTL